MKSALSKMGQVKFGSWGEFFSSPSIIAICQAHPLSAGIAAFFGGAYSQHQYETMNDYLHLLHARLQKVEQKYIDKDFYNSPDGRRILGKTLRSIFRDNRKEKLHAMANLTVNLAFNSKLTVDEKELYVDILDSLNSLQLSILQKAVEDMRTRQGDKHRGFGWEILAKEYANVGISAPLVTQSIRTLESNGLVNQNTADVRDQNQTHFITDFGEQFFDFIFSELKADSKYI